MSRTQRLLDLLQILRHHRFPVTAAFLAQELDVSVRTLYRDIASLQAQGADIEGEPGLGYVLRPGFMLPPLMFSEEEIEALVLGSRWVADRGDPVLAGAARNALQKIAAVLPASLREELDSTTMLAGPSAQESKDTIDLAILRQAIRKERKVYIQYKDAQEQISERLIWPFALGFFDHVRVLIAWCELRQEIRHFRSDRVVLLQVQEQRYATRRQALLKEWRRQQGIGH